MVPSSSSGGARSVGVFDSARGEGTTAIKGRCVCWTCGRRKWRWRKVTSQRYDLAQREPREG